MPAYLSKISSCERFINFGTRFFCGDLILSHCISSLLFIEVLRLQIILVKFLQRHRLVITLLAYFLYVLDVFLKWNIWSLVLVQIQMVCFDNLGLMLAAVLNILCKNNQRFAFTISWIELIAIMKLRIFYELILLTCSHETYIYVCVWLTSSKKYMLTFWVFFACGSCSY